ncbi:HdeD family acid-resistance protein [Pseudooceanicola sp. LIPI14-2-Ac024]|uniref:HdeD family acid-resistance protein n=1 Tax=Pseudooceanicola sp. LIPI14-2-Ac024 TaxID=3344875 RepID=UPI0035CEF460
MGNWIIWLCLGILAVIGGIFALLNPFAATVATTQIVAWFFLIGGILQIIAIFQVKGGWSKLWAGVLALVYIWLGITLIANPLQGVVTLTIVVAILFMVSGIAKIIYAFGMEERSYMWLMLLSGAISIILSIMIFTNFPGSAVVSLGILLAVELLVSGASLIAFAMGLRKLPEEQPTTTVA